MIGEGGVRRGGGQDGEVVVARKCIDHSKSAHYIALLWYLLVLRLLIFISFLKKKYVLSYFIPIVSITLVLDSYVIITISDQV